MRKSSDQPRKAKKLLTIFGPLTLVKPHLQEEVFFDKIILHLNTHSCKGEDLTSFRRQETERRRQHGQAFRALDLQGFPERQLQVPP